MFLSLFLPTAAAGIPPVGIVFFDALTHNWLVQDVYPTVTNLSSHSFFNQVTFLLSPWFLSYKYIVQWKWTMELNQLLNWGGLSQTTSSAELPSVSDLRWERGCSSASHAFNDGFWRETPGVSTCVSAIMLLFVFIFFSYKTFKYWAYH